MNTQNSTITKLAETALMAALCYVSFTFLQIKIPVPGGDATSIHIGNAFCVLAALLIGGVYGGLSGAIGMGIADLMDPVYITGAPKTFVLKFCIGLITGLVAHKIAKINESTDKKYVFKWSVIASVAGLAFNVVAAYIRYGSHRKLPECRPEESVPVPAGADRRSDSAAWTFHSLTARRWREIHLASVERIYEKGQGFPLINCGRRD